MTRTYNDRREEITASASQTAFTHGWRIDNAADVTVTHKVNATGVVTTLALTTHYTVDNVGVDGGGTITLVTGAAVNDLIILEDNRQPERAQDYTTSGDLLADTLDGDQDRRVDIMMNHERQLDRSLHLAPIELNAVSLELPVAVAGEAWRWDSAATAIEHFTPISDIGDDAELCFGDDDDFCIVYDSAEDQLEFRNPAGVELFTISDTLITFEGNSVVLSLGIAGSTATIQVSHTNNTNTSNNARLRATVAGASGGDAYMHWDITGGQNYVMGIDNSESDKLVLSRGATLGANNVLEITTTGAALFLGTLGVTGAVILSSTLASGALSVTGAITSTTTITATGIIQGATGSVFGGITLANGSITDSSGAISFGNENLSTTGNMSAAGSILSTGTAMGVTGASVGGTVQLACTNSDGTNTSSDAQFFIQTDSTGGDPYMQWVVLGDQNYVMGIDNSDSDKFVISRGTAIGTTNVLEITSAGAASFTGTLGATGAVTFASTLASGALTVTGAMSCTTTLTVTTTSQLTGDVSIGHAIPDDVLHIFNAGVCAIRVESSGDGNPAGIAFSRERNSGVNIIGAGIYVDSKTADNNPQLVFQVESSVTLGDIGTARMVIGDGAGGDGFVGIGTVVPLTMIHAHNTSSSSGLAVGTFEQDDVDDVFFNLIGTSAAASTASLSSSTAEAAAKFGAFRVQLNTGVHKWVRVYDSAV